jgi:hypothetical protein
MIHGSNPDRGKRIFLISKVSMPTVGYIQPPVQWAAGFFPRVKSSQDMKCTTYLTSTDVKNEWSYAAIHHMHVFIMWSGTTLPLQKITVRSVLYVRT